MTQNNDGTQPPSGPGPWNESPHQPSEPNPYSQGQPAPDPYAQPAPDPYGQPAPDPHGQPAPDPYGQPAPDPYGQAQQNPYGQTPPEQVAYGQQAANPYTQAQPGGVYPQQPQPAGAAPTEAYPAWNGEPPVGPPKKKRSAAPWIAAAVVLVLLVVGGIIGLNLGNAAHAPELQVQAYLDALKKGDAEDALKLAGTKVEKADLLLTDEAYKNAEDRITRYTISDTSVDGETATVTATITQGGEKYDQEFSLTKAGKDAVIFDKWELDEPAIGSLSVGVTAPENAVIEVSGVDASSARSEGAIELRALPGTYAVALGGDASWYAAEPTSASVVGFGSDAAEAEPLVIALTEEGTTAATDAVNAWLDDCIASTELAPPGCPFSATNSQNYEISNLVWTVTKPTFSIGEFADGVWPVLTDSEGDAKATATAKDPSTGATGTIFTDLFSFDIGGAIDGFTDDGATFVPAD